MEKNTSFLHVRITPELKQNIKDFCNKKNMKKGESKIIKLAIEKYIKEN